MLYDVRKRSIQKYGKQQKQKSYTCHRCQLVCKTKSILRHHLVVHSEERPYLCNLCDKSFKRQSDRDGHQKVHSDDKPFACDKCPLRYKRKFSLDVHVRTHSYARPFECVICSISFREKHNLKHHYGTKRHKTNLMESTKTVERKPFECTLCEESFTLEHSLAEHLKIHQGPSSVVDSAKLADGCRPLRKKHLPQNQDVLAAATPNRVAHECGFCSQKFKRAKHMKAHIEDVHKVHFFFHSCVHASCWA